MDIKTVIFMCAFFITILLTPTDDVVVKKNYNREVYEWLVLFQLLSCLFWGYSGFIYVLLDANDRFIYRILQRILKGVCVVGIIISYALLALTYISICLLRCYA